MSWAIRVKRPTDGSILHAGKGCCGGRGPLRRACPEAVLPETESPDPARSVGPVIDSPLQAFQPPVRDGLGVEGLPAEH